MRFPGHFVLAVEVHDHADVIESVLCPKQEHLWQEPSPQLFSRLGVALHPRNLAVHSVVQTLNGFLPGSTSYLSDGFLDMLPHFALWHLPDSRAKDISAALLGGRTPLAPPIPRL